MRNFITAWDYKYWLKSNEFYIGFNTPDALLSKKGEENEYQHGLPPYAKREGFLVDEYPACPKNWMRSEGKLTSYFIPVKEGQGMWLDFNKNTEHKYHVAIVISVQGINPITGLPCNDPQLEQYIEACPKHKTKFGPERLCKKCGFKWPKQNYICSNATPTGQFWLDGFRSAEGVVRQYILTQEKMRGVASNIIGKDRVYAIGLSFFLSKEPKPIMDQTQVLRSMPQFFSPCCTPINWPPPPVDPSPTFSDPNNIYTVCGTGDTSQDTYKIMNNSLDIPQATPVCNSSTAGGSSMSSGNNTKRRKCSEEAQTYTQEVKTQALEVGAGANIKQAVFNDPEPLDFWRTNPEALICINYADEISCTKIIEAGRIKLDGHPEGFLNKVPVGNPVAVK